MILIILKRLGNMPYLQITLKTFLVISLLLSASIFFLLKVNYAESLKFQQEQIDIQRTQFGIPHVKASSFKAAMYGWGYVTAEDRLFQLAFKRLVGKGKISKYLGKKAVKVDKMFREFNFQHWAQKTVEKLQRQNATEYNNFQSFVKGINDQVDNLNFLPIEFYLIGLQWQPWTVSDMFLQSKLLVWSQSVNMADEYVRSNLLEKYTKQEVIELIPFGSKWDGFDLINIVSDKEIIEKLQKWTYQLDAPKFDPARVEDLQQLGIMEYIDDGRGSNSWVIHGNHTKSGFPLNVNDPHLQSAIPQQWYQIRVEYLHNGRTVYMQGAAMTGLPAIIGKSPYATVTLTTIHADSQDLYKQKVEGDHYELDGQKVKLKQRRQIIEIKNQESIQHIVQQTHRGPIISSISHWGTLYQLKGTDKLSLAWTGFHDEYETWVVNSHWGQIDNLDDMKQFLLQKTYGGPNMNALYSTIDNHIGYMAIGSLPQRRNHASGNFIKDGSTTQQDWIGLIKKQGQLNVHDPSKGYIVTANNRPASSKYQNGVFQSSQYTTRANRIDQMIRQKIQKGIKFTPQHMKEMQLDTVDIFCIKNVPILLQQIPKSEQYLTNFNCDFTRQSHQATIYEVFFYQLYRIINPDKLNNYNLMSSYSYLLYLNRYIRNSSQQDHSLIMNKAFQETIYNLTDFFGTQNKEKWIWETYHPDVIIHRPFSASQVLKPLYEKRYGGVGNANTVNVAKMSKHSYGDFTTNHHGNIRLILSHSPDQKSYWIGDTGASQKFYSKHYDDQFKLYTKDEYLQINFNSSQKPQDSQF